jgi:hypothetical protein
MADKIFKFLTDLIDNATLIIIVLFVVMILQKDAQVTDTIVGGLLGYMTAKGGGGGQVH